MMSFIMADHESGVKKWHLLKDIIRYTMTKTDTEKLTFAHVKLHMMDLTELSIRFGKSDVKTQAMRQCFDRDRVVFESKV
jgi:hypothetical protein